MLAIDADEVTLVVDEKNVQNFHQSGEEKWFKMFEIKVAKPFYSVGFLAAISSEIAKSNVNIIIISTFSKDYVFVKENELNKTLDALLNLGLQYNQSDGGHD